MSDSVLERTEKLESVTSTLSAELQLIKSQLQSAQAIAGAANGLANQLVIKLDQKTQELSQRTDAERVLNRPVFIQSTFGGYLSDRNNQGGDGKFVDAAGPWEEMTLKPK